MPTPERHLEYAERNALLARRLLKAAPEWATVLAFYSALHHVERYASKERDGCFGHKERATYIGETGELWPIQVDYALLRTLSERVRYECPPMTNELYDVAHVEAEVFPLLSHVKDHIDYLMNLTQTG